MDILGEYERQHPAAPAPAPRTFPRQAEYGFFIRLVIKLSGNKIENGHQASFVLLVFAAAVLVISLIIFLRTNGWFSAGQSGLNVPIAGPQDPRLKNQTRP